VIHSGTLLQKQKITLKLGREKIKLLVRRAIRQIGTLGIARYENWTRKSIGKEALR